MNLKVNVDGFCTIYSDPTEKYQTFYINLIVCLSFQLFFIEFCFLYTEICTLLFMLFMLLLFFAYIYSSRDHIHQKYINELILFFKLNEMLKKQNKTTTKKV